VHILHLILNIPIKVHHRHILLMEINQLQTLINLHRLIDHLNRDIINHHLQIIHIQEPLKVTSNKVHNPEITSNLHQADIRQFNPRLKLSIITITEVLQAVELEVDLVAESHKVEDHLY
jgi:hypothetical protein